MADIGREFRELNPSQAGDENLAGADERKIQQSVASLLGSVHLYHQTAWTACDAEQYGLASLHLRSISNLMAEIKTFPMPETCSMPEDPVMNSILVQVKISADEEELAQRLRRASREFWQQGDAFFKNSESVVPMNVWSLRTKESKEHERRNDRLRTEMYVELMRKYATKQENTALLEGVLEMANEFAPRYERIAVKPVWLDAYMKYVFKATKAGLDVSDIAAELKKSFDAPDEAVRFPRMPGSSDADFKVSESALTNLVFYITRASETIFDGVTSSTQRSFQAIAEGDYNSFGIFNGVKRSDLERLLAEAGMENYSPVFSKKAGRDDVTLGAVLAAKEIEEQTGVLLDGLKMTNAVLSHERVGKVLNISRRRKPSYPTEYIHDWQPN